MVVNPALIPAIIFRSFPMDATSGNEMLTLFRQRLNEDRLKLNDDIINFLLSRADIIWNEGVNEGLSIDENLVFTRVTLISGLGTTETPIFVIPDIDIDIPIPDIPNPLATLEWLQKNWLLIIVVIVVAIIIIIIVFSVMVTGPLMEAMMIGALS